MEPPAIPADKLADVYIKIRTKRELLAKEFEAVDSELKAKQELLETEMLELCKAAGADSIKTSFGTIIKTLKERYWSTDRAAFNRFVFDNNALDLFENRIHQGNMKIWIAEHPEQFPPSVNVDRAFTVSVRRPTNKAIQ
jgi:hypothetical protein